MDTQSPKDKLQMYLDARRPIIYIRNFDFQAVDRLLHVRLSHLVKQAQFFSSFFAVTIAAISFSSSSLRTESSGVFQYPLLAYQVIM